MTPAERQKKVKERERTEREQRDSDLRAVLSTPAGRRFVWDVINVHSGRDMQSFQPLVSGDTALLMAFSDGRRSVGLDLHQLVKEVAPRSWLEMTVEQARWEEEKLQAQAAEAVPPASEGRDS